MTRLQTACVFLLCAMACGSVSPEIESRSSQESLISCLTFADCAPTCEICVMGACVGKAPAGTVCRKTAGGVATADGTSPSSVCDPPEVCDGVASGVGSCPADAYAPAGMSCGSAAVIGPCDIADKCNAAGRCAARKPMGTVCKLANPLSPICDPQDLCDGLRLLCPSVYAPVGMSCDAGKFCGLNGTCS